MPIYHGKRIDVYTPLEAYYAGYWTRQGYVSTMNWMLDKPEQYKSRIIFIDGRYRGCCKANTPLHAIVERFKL